MEAAILRAWYWKRQPQNRRASYHGQGTLTVNCGDGIVRSSCGIMDHNFSFRKYRRITAIGNPCHFSLDSHSQYRPAFLLKSVVQPPILIAPANWVYEGFLSYASNGLTNSACLVLYEG